jgi:hypothetical protein
VKSDLIALARYAFERTTARLQGLTDDEYLWEPVPDAWSVRTASDGSVQVDTGSSTSPGSFTTLAWRIWHLCDCYGSARNERWLLGTDDGDASSRCRPRADTAGALESLDVAVRWWLALLEALPEADLGAPLGAVAGTYASHTKASFVLHEMDEHIHHGAEIGLLRDLYAEQRPH